jgi:hypothetical protein
MRWCIPSPFAEPRLPGELGATPVERRAYADPEIIQSFRAGMLP